MAGLADWQVVLEPGVCGRAGCSAGLCTAVSPPSPSPPSWGSRMTGCGGALEEKGQS